MSYELYYVIAFIATAGLCAALTRVTILYAQIRNIVDQPTGGRKIHARAVPLLGGIAIFLSMALVALGFSLWTDKLVSGYIHANQLIAIGAAGLVLMIGGYLDDRYRLSPGKQLIAPALATLLIIAANIGIRSFTNPAGGFFKIGWDELPLFAQPLPLVLSVVWIMGMMYTTKILDGLDGLVSGLSVIGSLVIFGVSMRPELQQYSVGLLALIFAGACTGFLAFNFNPAKIFLGEGGSLFCGFMLGVLSIIAGTKIATALLIMGIPILDLAWVLYCRWRTGASLVIGDRRHLHFKFLEAGFSQRQTVLMLYAVTGAFGAAAVLLQTREKMIAFGLLALVLATVGSWLMVRYKKRTGVC